MATDQSPPRIRIILTIAFSSLVVLITLNFVFRSYFLMMTEQVEHDHLAPPTELLKLRADEERNLTTGAVPIAKAMTELRMRGREATDALKPLADITPKPSDDLGPMIGWMQSPNEYYIDRQSAAAAASASAPAAPADGGVANVASAAPTGSAAPAHAGPADAGAAPAPKTPPTHAPAPKH